MTEEAMLLTEEMQDYGLELSSDTLLAMHNYCWETDKQKLIVDWAKEKHPAVWDEAVKSQLLKGATNYEPRWISIGLEYEECVLEVILELGGLVILLEFEFNDSWGTLFNALGEANSSKSLILSPGG
ncbi:hypothetical protein QCA50_009981 [Cerrena zonata]|uniref:Uncharacterized protein n=1 Tax=Cerrena zonata TaxID=2478898 RepID=A0AAW0G9M3_9APHY